MGANAPEFSVSELSAAVKRTLEGAYGYVRLRGEISGFKGAHASGHCYFALKDDKAKIEAVIWDRLAGFAERFPVRVVLWPVRVQGEPCAAEVAAAIKGFNALAPGGRVPRPDILIVARGGGSLEDLWGFNEEIVVRAASAS